MTAWELVDRECAARGYDVRRVRSQSRLQEHVWQRSRIAKVLRACGYSLPEIGRVLGGRHHTTVLSMLRGGKGTKRFFMPKRYTRPELGCGL